ncbi:hypothetical protein JCM8115_002551 [Rhodotorula mucilaginosa]|uniref:Uncharacterized protein n=1 Tax=Rhodotorula mucilaginosa TaxID=5537 RepID=A0A9P6W6M1_RHOMI|nr:hypothetical protein C6P46_001904 [Rhodotorula mucilaginosa]TKA56453.1 hypothetical protein B0A53_02024 [Rhodotorula sp. CCFEE 5036]
MADREQQRFDENATTAKHPVGAQHGAVVNQNEEFYRDPPNNLGLAHPEEQDRASDLIGSTNTEPIADPPSAEEQRRVQELAARLNK